MSKTWKPPSITQGLINYGQGLWYNYGITMGSFWYIWYHALLEGEKLKIAFGIIVLDSIIWNCMLVCIKYPGQA